MDHHSLRVVTMDKVQRLGQHGDDILQIVVRQVATAQDKVYVMETLGDERRVQHVHDDIANGQDLHDLSICNINTAANLIVAVQLIIRPRITFAKESVPNMLSAWASGHVRKGRQKGAEW